MEGIDLKSDGCFEGKTVLIITKFSKHKSQVLDCFSFFGDDKKKKRNLSIFPFQLLF